MNTIKLNTIGTPCKAGGNSGGGGGGNTPSKPKWTGHADAEGLRAIGWTDEDIAYYQQNGVNWNAEDDQYHLVSDDNKALYGVLTADNIQTYRERIVYLPKIDTSAKTNMNSVFSNCCSLVSIPQLDTSNVTSMNSMFIGCYSLTCIPQLDTSNVTSMSTMFQSCYSLTSIPQLDTAKVTNMFFMFESCCSLTTIPILNTSNVANMSNMFGNCYSLASIPKLDTSNATNMGKMFYYCIPLRVVAMLDVGNVTSISDMFYKCRIMHLKLKNIKASCNLTHSVLLSKESLLYLINNEAATSAITIKLASYAYTRLANDADVVAALSNHPNISISQ